MAFEFRCPYGLVFDETKLVCEWPWLVPACSESGSSYTRTEYNYGGYTAGASTGGRVGGYVTSGLPEYSVTARTDYSNMDYSRTTGAGIHGTNYFESTARDIGKRPGTSIPGTVSEDFGLSGTASADYSKSTGYGGAVSSAPTYSGIQIGSVPPSTIVVGEGGTGYSASSSKIGDTEYTVSTGQGGAGYSVSGFNTGFTHRGGVTAGFSGSTAGEYSRTVSGSHLQDVTYSGRPISNYPSSIAGGYTGRVSTSNPIIDTSYSSTPGSYFGSTRLPVDVHVGSTSPKYIGSMNVYADSSTFNADGYSTSTGIYSGATGRQPSFGQTGPPFGSVSYPGAIGNVEITGSTNRQYAGSAATAYGKSTGAAYSTAAGGISAGSTESNINLSGSGIGSNLYSTDSGRISGTDFISGIPKSGTSRISTVPGQVSITSGPGISSTGYKYNSEEGYTIPVFVQHEEPIYHSIGTTGTGVRGHVSTGTSGVGLTGGYGKTDFARPHLNVSIFGNEIPTSYDIQKGTTGAIQTESSVGGNIITSDSFSGTVFSHGNVPGAISTPSINQGTILTKGAQSGYIATSSGIPGYVINDGVKTVDVGSFSPGTSIYGTPSPAISISGPSTDGVFLKGDSTPGTVISGQTAPGVSIGGSIQSGSTIESSTHKTYESQSTYHGISAPARGSITYSSSTPSEGLISTAPQGYQIDGGRGTVTLNAAYDINKYTENDIPDYRPTSSVFPDAIVPGGRIEGTAGGSAFAGSTTVTPGRFSSKSAVFTPSGFTKTGPTRTGFTTAVLGGGGSYSVSTSERRPTYNPDNISEKAFEGNVAGYTKTSSIDNLSVTLTPPGYSSTAAPGGPVQSATSSYSYPKPSVQFGTSGATFSSAPIGNNFPVTTSKPFLIRLPTSTVMPVIYTTDQPEIYKTTLFESKKIPITVSTVRPLIDTGYKTVISSTTVPVSVLIDDRFTQRTGGLQTASVSTSDLGVPFQHTDSSGQIGSSLGYLPSKSTEPGDFASTAKYDVPTVPPRPDLIGVTYKKPSPYGGPSSFQSPTTFRPPSGYFSGQGFSTTSSSLGVTPSGGSPINLDISRDKIDKLITNYDRGTVRYTPTKYDTYTSSGFDSTKKFTSSSTKPSFSTKFGGGFAVTPPGIRPSTLSYEVTTKSPEGKGKVIIKWSDLHPLLLGKLGAECTCKADPFANLRGPVKKLIDSSRGKVDLANYDSSEIYVDLGSSEGGDYSVNYDNLPDQPYKISAPETAGISTNLPSSAYLPPTDSRLSAKNNEFRSNYRMGKKLEYEEEEEEKEEYDDDPDQIINGVTDCARPGLFRHPSLCNKFYACHWDQWKKKFTLHIFNCPIHLTFDTSAGACNWPSKGPACQANNLLV